MAQCLARSDDTDYSASLLADVATQAAATNTTYNGSVYNYYYAAAVEDILTYMPSYYAAGAATPGWSSDGGTSVDLAVVQAGIDAYNADPTGTPLMIDMETWSSRTRWTVNQTAINNFLSVANAWQTYTDRAVGWYSWVPYSFYTHITAYQTAVAGGDAVSESLYQAYVTTDMKLNEQAMALIWDAVDFLVPRCYVYSHDSIAAWKWYASYSILEAIRLARGIKPVWPIWFYQATSVGEDLAEAEFLAAAKFVTAFPGIDASIAWSAANPPAYWLGHVGDLVAGTEEFAPPPPP